MTTGRYLLTLDEWFGDNPTTTKHLIQAEDKQMVKYHFHRTLKDWGYTHAEWADDKHTLESWDIGAVEIASIDELLIYEWDVLEKYVTKWTKV